MSYNSAAFNPIPYPHSLSEFEIQASLYNKLKELGYDVRGEVKAKCFDYGQIRSTRFDLVIFSKIQLPMLIIECKNDYSDELIFNRPGRQGRRYNTFGVPVIIHSGKHESKVIEYIEEKIADMLFV